jgi:DNA uptake protein ComE-like DNA-binding protein
MRPQLFFWFKTHLGFSGKESRGFLLLIPFLLVLVGASQVLAWAKDRNAQKLYQQYLDQVDSLERAGVLLLGSPLPTYNPEDTLKRLHSTKVADRIQRLPFSESDSVVLQIVPGIGAKTAGRIIKHRENLGGFIQRTQLTEVYGLQPETIPLIWDYFDFDTVVPRQLYVNTLAVDELARHPYISYQEAKVLVAYRLNHGPFHQAKDLLRIKIFKAEWVSKISPYLNFSLSEKKATSDSLEIQ